MYPKESLWLTQTMTITKYRTTFDLINFLLRSFLKHQIKQGHFENKAAAYSGYTFGRDNIWYLRIIGRTFKKTTQKLTDQDGPY